ncbi:AMP-binding protein [Microbulbifer sp. PSTR4-B]|uniref:AMP-binding protein n=1 Tax=Microbulbifer sp. PSTR4-B TaxID=3243396 RepID=UPI0040394487
MDKIQFEQVFGYSNDQAIVSYSSRGEISFAQFKRELAFIERKLKKSLNETGFKRAAIFCEDSYEFSLLFFAAMSCCDVVVIPANNKRFTQQKLGEQTLLLGSWEDSSAFSINIPDQCREELSVPSCFDAGIQLFTSGTSGEPQTVDKTLYQLLNEVKAHNLKWSPRVANTTTLATVSHQHIYGLLFKLLWPLASGRRFVSKTYVDIVGLLQDAHKWGPAVWVASPAQLSRRISSWPWALGKSLVDIFSSGGPLLEVDAKAIDQLCGIQPIEVYGSTETGGIAWRNQLRQKSWSPLKGVNIAKTSDGLLKVSSPWLPKEFICQDKVQISTDGMFELKGRADRIVKIEEKRISLTQVESLLVGSSYIVKANALVLERKRKIVAAVATLTESGKELLQKKGKASLVRKLRETLAKDLDGVAVPRSWRFVDEIPVNLQGKITRDLLMQLFDEIPAAMVPQIISSEILDNTRQVNFTVNDDLPCLDGHFEGSPVVPGVVQLDWAMHFGRPLVKAGSTFTQMEVIKFKQLMMPGDAVTLSLEFSLEKNKLNYSFRNTQDGNIEYSSGRLCFSHV